MGLFKSILGKVAESVIAQIKDAATGQVAPHSDPVSKPATTPAYTAPVREKSAAEWVQYFREILQAECAGYAIRENVPVTDLVGAATDEFKLYNTRPRQAYKAEWGQPYSFVLYQGGVPKAVVMLGSGHSHDSNVKYLIARMYAKKQGLPYINFYTQMPNQRGYVAGRIRKFLA